ncbi:CheY FOG, CheY-like receiver [Comamonadaceae bacterium]|jgi:two-component system chemotaxis response regulator CheY|uniref:response regulator n=1 Tax=Curvibacter sp. AEP1-3 TaxID=1844971 RepID=UPI000B3C63C1|nr:response regulator [Curvibacter sp. AEP1-3]ARV18376.1 Response regulator MprA [Curvibacter sp. AEP1-3]NBW48953.1 response regulator [Betaproteobacteria bacterium]NBX20196.1 response regulator [Betaproteobacteria bacterium]
MAKTIMIVDDSLTMTMSVKSSLEMNGFSVQTAADGVQALTKLKGGLKPDLIITDINMPNMGGLELIRQVKALPGYRFVPILTLTTESDASKRDEGKKLGATGWLVKPVSGPDLVKVVKQVVPGA